MNSNLAEQVKEVMEHEYWGYEAYYWPEYEDFVKTKSVPIKKKFLFFYYIGKKEIPDFVIKKENMKPWTKVDYEYVLFLFSNPIKDFVYVFVDHDKKIILFR